MPGWDVEQTIAFARELQEWGCDAVHVSNGGLHPAQKIPVGPRCQVPLAREVRSAVDMP
jgi:2,4-dienoyl-CoA reductase-like NADH-dependent reductase (Old Yellow Enzyme family)